MNLDECLKAVETGSAGQEHAEWLRENYVVPIYLYTWDDLNRICEGLRRERDMRERERNDARAWSSLWKRAAKGWLGIADDWQVNAELEGLDRKSRRKERDEARADAVKVALECRELAQGAAYWERCYTEVNDLLVARTHERDNLQRDNLQDKLDARGEARSLAIRIWKLVDEKKALRAELNALKAENEYLRAEAICGECDNRGSSSFVGWENDLCQRVCTAPQELQDRLKRLRELQAELADYRSGAVISRDTAIELERVRLERDDWEKVAFDRGEQRDALRAELEVLNHEWEVERETRHAYGNSCDALQAELDELKARRCETCESCGPLDDGYGVQQFCDKRVVGVIGNPIIVGCSEWEPQDTGCKTHP